MLYTLTVFAAANASAASPEPEDGAEAEAAPNDNANEPQQRGEEEDIDVLSLTFQTEPTGRTWRDARPADGNSSAGEEDIVSRLSCDPLQLFSSDGQI